MKICIVSPDGLPDARVEKVIRTLIEEGHEIHFIGPFKGTTGIVKYSNLASIAIVEWNVYANLGMEPYYHWVKRKLSKVLKRIRPDLVIVANIVAATMVHQLGYNMIYDDHELYSKEIEYKYEPKSMIKKFIKKRKIKLYSKWERIVSEHHPVMVVSEATAKYYRTHLGATRVEVVKNYPMKCEIEKLSMNYIDCKTINLVYIGNDISKSEPAKYRNLKPFLVAAQEVYRKSRRLRLIVVGDPNLKGNEFIASVGVVPHLEMYDYTIRAHFGVLAWNPSPFHIYCNPNKPYIYAHGGAIPIITSTLDEVLKDLGSYSLVVPSIDFENRLKACLESILAMDCEHVNKLRKELFYYARTYLLWDLQKSKILNLLKSC